MRCVGELLKTAIAYVEDGKYYIKSEFGDPVTESEKKRIKIAISRAESYGYDLKSVRHRYLIVDKFYETDFRKSIPPKKNPIMRSKYFNIFGMMNLNEKMISDQMPDAQTVADFLSNKSWEDFD